MNNPVTLLIFLFLIIHVQCASIPINADPDGEERLQDLSARPKRMDEATRNLLIAGEKIEERGIGHLPRFHRLNELQESKPSRKTKRCPRYYLADNPNLIVGANLKRNLKKLCDQCLLTPMCRGREDCGHCARYCKPYGAESKRNDVTSSMEEVGIAREPETDPSQHETVKDMTLVSRSAVGNELPDREGVDGNLDREEPSPRLQMIHDAIDGEQDEKVIVTNQRRAEEEKEDMIHAENGLSRYYTVGVISPGLLMNIMLKLLNIKQTAEMEQTIVLVKSKKPVPLAVGFGGKIDVEFLRMLGRELETTEKIHGKHLLEAKDINKILETAYEKAELKLKSEGQIVKEAAPENAEKKFSSDNSKSKSKTSAHNENINENPVALAEQLLQRNDEAEAEVKENMEDTDLDIPLEENENSRTPHHKKYKHKKKTGQMYSYSAHQGTYQHQPYGYGRSNMAEQPVPNQDTEEPLIGSQPNLSNEEESGNDQDTDLDIPLEENENSRTPHHKKYKHKNKKTGQMYSYSSHQGTYQNQAYGYGRSNMAEQQVSNQNTEEPLIGSHPNLSNEEESVNDQDTDLDIPLEENENSRTPHHKKYKHKKTKKGQMYSYSSHQGTYQHQPYGYGRSNIGEQPVPNQNTEEPLKGSHPNLLNGEESTNDQDSVSSSFLERKAEAENTKIDAYSTDSSHKITATNDDMNTANGNPKKLLSAEQVNENASASKLITEEMIGSQQESLRPHNEDRIGFKDDFQRDQKGLNYKGLGDLLKIPTKTQKIRNNGEMIDSEMRSESSSISGSTKNEDNVRGDIKTDVSSRDSEGIAQINLTDKNKQLDPKKVSIARPNEDNHDGMPKAFHTRIHAHFNKVQEFFDKKSGGASGNSEPTVGAELGELPNFKEDEVSSNIKMTTRNNGEISSDKIVINSGIEDRNLDDMPKVGMNFQQEELENSERMTNNDQKIEIENSSIVGSRIDPQDSQEKTSRNKEHTEISQSRASDNIEKEFPSHLSENGNEINEDIKEFGSQFNGPLFTNSDKNLPGQKIIQVDDQLIDVPYEGSSIFQVNNQPISMPANDIPIKQPSVDTDSENVGVMNTLTVENSKKGPQMMTDPSGRHFESSAKSEDAFATQNRLRATSFGLDNEEISKGTSSINADEKIYSEYANSNSQFSKITSLKDKSPAGASSRIQSLEIIPDGQKHSSLFNKQSITSEQHELRENNNGLLKVPFSTNSYSQSETDQHDSKRLSAQDNEGVSNNDPEFPSPNIIAMNRKAPAFRSSTSQNIVKSEDPSSDPISTTAKESIGISQKSMSETVGASQKEFENEIEEKIEKLISPKEKEFLHNFGKIVPSIEKMNLNSNSDIFFMGNGIKLPLKMSPNEDGSISLSVDLEKLCKCKNATCANNMEMMNRLDENLMEMSNDLPKPEVLEIDKNENDNNVPLIENIAEKKIRKPRHHMDLSKLYRTYRKKYHRLQKRSISNEYLKQFGEIKQSLEKKLDQLNENVKKSNEEYDNMLRKGTKDLLKTKEEDEVVRQRIELVQDLLQWMKVMASGVTKNVA